MHRSATVRHEATRWSAACESSRSRDPSAICALIGVTEKLGCRHQKTARPHGRIAYRQLQQLGARLSADLRLERFADEILRDNLRSIIRPGRLTLATPGAKIERPSSYRRLLRFLPNRAKCRSRKE